MLSQIAYELAAIEKAVERFDTLIPRSDTWPAEFASRLIADAIVFSGGVSQYGQALLENVIEGVQPSVAAVLLGVAKASDALVTHAKIVSNALGAKADLTTSAGMREAIFGLLREAARSWRALRFIDESRPLFDRLRTKELNQTRQRIGTAIDRQGRILLELPVPKFPGDDIPVEPIPKGEVPRQGSPWIITGIAFVAAGVTGLAIWRGRRLG